MMNTILRSVVQSALYWFLFVFALIAAERFGSPDLIAALQASIRNANAHEFALFLSQTIGIGGIPGIWTFFLLSLGFPALLAVVWSEVPLHWLMMGRRGHRIQITFNQNSLVDFLADHPKKASIHGNWIEIRKKWIGRNLFEIGRELSEPDQLLDDRLSHFEPIGFALFDISKAHFSQSYRIEAVYGWLVVRFGEKSTGLIFAKSNTASPDNEIDIRAWDFLRAIFWSNTKVLHHYYQISRPINAIVDDIARINTKTQFEHLMDEPPKGSTRVYAITRLRTRRRLLVIPIPEVQDVLYCMPPSDGSNNLIPICYGKMLRWKKLV